MASLSQSQTTALLRPEAFRGRHYPEWHPPTRHLVTPFLRPDFSPILPAAPSPFFLTAPRIPAIGGYGRSRRVAVSSILTRQDGQADEGMDARKAQRAAQKSEAASAARQGGGVTGRGAQMSGMQGAVGSGEQAGDGRETAVQRPSAQHQQDQQQQQQLEQAEGARKASSSGLGLGSGIQELGSGFQGLGSGFQGLGSGIQGLGSGIQGRASAVRSRLQGGAMEAGSRIQGGAYGVGSSLQDTAAVVGGVIQGRAVEVGGAIQGKAVAVGSTIQDTAVVVGGAIQDKAVAVSSTIQDTAVVVGGAIQDTAVVVGSRIQGKAVELQERAVEVGTSIQDRAVEVSSSLQDRAVLLQGKAVEVSSTLQDVVSEVGQVVTEVGVTIQEKQQEIAKVVQHTAEDVERSLPPPAQGALRTAGSGVQAVVSVVAPVLDRIPVTRGQLAGAAVVVVLFIKAVEQWWYQFQQDSRGSTHFDIPERIRVEAPSPLPPACACGVDAAAGGRAAQGAHGVGQHAAAQGQSTPVNAGQREATLVIARLARWMGRALHAGARVPHILHGLERWMVGIVPAGGCQVKALKVWPYSPTHPPSLLPSPLQVFRIYRTGLERWMVGIVQAGGCKACKLCPHTLPLPPPPLQVFRIYRTGLERWMVGILQPLIDETPKPRGVQRVRIKQFFLGDEPPSLRSIERRTSRRGNDLQYYVGVGYHVQPYHAVQSDAAVYHVAHPACHPLSYHVGVRYTGGMRMLLEVPVDVSMGLSAIPLTVPIPVGVRNFDVDAEVWVRLKLIPVEPWVGALTWAFVSMPKVKLTLAPFRVPLSCFFDLCLSPVRMCHPCCCHRGTHASTHLPVMISPSPSPPAIPFLSRYLQALLTEELPARFLRPNSKEVDLLKDRPLPPDPAQREFREGQVASGTLGFAGELQVTVIAAQRVINLPLGDSDPYVVLELGQQVARSKRNSETSLVGPAGYPIWNQDFVLLVLDPTLQRLSVKLRGSLGLFYVDFGHGSVRLGSLHDTLPTHVWAPLHNPPVSRLHCPPVSRPLQVRLDALQDTVPTDVWVPMRLRLPVGQKACGRVKMRLTYKAFVAEDDHQDVETFDQPYSEAESDGEGADALATISRLRRFVADVADSAAPPELMRILENVRVGEIPRVVDLERLSSDVAKLSDLARALEVALFKDVNRLAELPRLSDLPKMKEFSVLAELASIRADIERLAQAARALELGAELEKRVKVDLSRIDLDLSSVDLPKWDEWMAVPRRALPQPKDLVERYRLLLPDAESRRRQREREARAEGGEEGRDDDGDDPDGGTGGVRQRGGWWRGGWNGKRGEGGRRNEGNGRGGAGGKRERTGVSGVVRRGMTLWRGESGREGAEEGKRDRVDGGEGVRDGREGGGGGDGKEGGGGGGEAGGGEWASGGRKKIRRVTPAVVAEGRGKSAVVRRGAEGQRAEGVEGAFEWREALQVFEDVWGMMDGSPSMQPGSLSGRQSTSVPDAPVWRGRARSDALAGQLRADAEQEGGVGEGRYGNGRAGMSEERFERVEGEGGGKVEGDKGVNGNGRVAQGIVTADVDEEGASMAAHAAESAAAAMAGRGKGWISPSLQSAGGGASGGRGVGHRDGDRGGDGDEQNAGGKSGSGAVAGVEGRGVEEEKGARGGGSTRGERRWWEVWRAQLIMV
ncbi:unnamed protein product [Closterium sp. NIES-64]|nr:unnamed protein product [Closterium sp. NIES-64]